MRESSPRERAWKQAWRVACGNRMVMWGRHEKRIRSWCCMGEVLIRSASTLGEAKEVIRMEAGRSTHLIPCEQRSEWSHSSFLRQSKCSQVDDAEYCLSADSVQRGRRNCLSVAIIFSAVCTSVHHRGWEQGRFLLSLAAFYYWGPTCLCGALSIWNSKCVLKAAQFCLWNQ